MMFLEQKLATRLTASVGLAFLLANCGAFKTKNKGEKARENDSALTGEWQGVCVPVLEPLDWHIMDTLTMSAAGDFDRSEVFYGDDNCQQEMGTLQVSGTYASLGQAKGLDAKDINLTTTEAKLTPKTEDAAKKLNDLSFCGIGNWQVGQTQDILDKACVPVSFHKGEVAFDVYQVNGDRTKMSLGKSTLLGNKISLGDRPTSLDTERTFTKK